LLLLVEAFNMATQSAAAAAPAGVHERMTTRQTVVGFVAASLAPATSAIFTNPIEVVKVRQQIDRRPGGMAATLR
jgi:hypothetical protein